MRNLLECSYIHLKEAWYRNSVFPAYPDMIDEIQIEVQAKENSESNLSCELSFRLMKIGENRKSWEFCMFDDSFQAFRYLSEELTQVMCHINEYTRAEEIIQMLKMIGYVDATKRNQFD